MGSQGPVTCSLVIQMMEWTFWRNVMAGTGLVDAVAGEEIRFVAAGMPQLCVLIRVVHQHVPCHVKAGGYIWHALARPLAPAPFPSIPPALLHQSHCPSAPLGGQ